MAVHIFDEDALDKLALLEGEEWKKEQEKNTASAYGFFAYKAAWQFMQENREWEGELPAHPIKLGMVPGVYGDGDGAIYGKGGYARYVVNSAGRIFLLDWSATVEKRYKALEVGF